MPLTAFVNGVNIFSMAIPVEEWHCLRSAKPYIVLACCGAAGHMRTSSTGLQHFYHRSKSHECASGVETQRHLELKARIVKAVEERGWVAIPEASDVDSGWRADVLATKGKFKIAFEAQLAAIDFPEIQNRQARYKASGVRAAWLLGGRALKCAGLLRLAQSTPEPIFALDDADQLSIAGLSLSLESAIGRLLQGDFRHQQNERITETTSVRFFRVSRCYACGDDFDVYFVEQDTLGCGNTLYDSRCLDLEFPYMAYAMRAQVIDRIRSFLKTREGRQLRPTFPWWLETNGGRCYRSFTCHCGAIMSSDLWSSLREYGQFLYDPNLTMVPCGSFELWRKVTFERSSHWCVKCEWGFCEDSR